MAKLPKTWRFFPVKPDLNERLASSFVVSKVIAQLLINRGQMDDEAVRVFLHGTADNLGNPFLLKGCDTAVARITQAIDDKEKIIVYGDYDVDGITATALMLKVLGRLGANIDYYIPDRQSEGYGLNADALEQFIRSGADLLISVDCGISAVEAVEQVKSRLDIIITDHHEPPELLPDALAIINPKQNGCLYPEKNLAGVGVAFKVCQALWRKIKQQDLTDLFELVAIGTIADIVPLVGENRILVKLGLKQLNSTANVGLQALIDVCGLTKNQVDAGKIGYVMAPRLNAAGRLGQASGGVELLLTADKSKAAELAGYLDYSNAQRQLVEKEILAKAEEQLKTIDIAAARVLVLAGDNWHCGVIGIVASRIVDRYYRPTIIIGIQDGIGKGSGRSIAGFDLYRALEQCGDLLLQYGGHQQAAGLSIDAAHIDTLRTRLDKIAAQVLAESDYTPVLTIDAEVALEEVNAGLLEELACLEPFGMGNPSPVFACRNVILSDIRAIGQDGRHLKFRVRRKNASSDGIAWEMGELTARLQRNSSVDIAFQPELNHWNGQCKVQLKTRDIREFTGDMSELDELYATDHLNNKYKNALQSGQFFTKIVGVTFENRQDTIARLHAGQPLYLQREPSNVYDGNAIRAEDGKGSVVGYLPAGLAKEMAVAMDSGCRFRCMITAVTGGEDWPWGVNVLIFQECPAREPAKRADGESIRLALLGERPYHDSQRLVLEKLAAGKNTLTIMGTGRGKSAIFQSHAAALALSAGQLTIVLYPLRALVNDQYIQLSRKMSKLGLRVFKGNGTLTTEERAALFAALHEGSVDILLTTPEFADAHMGLLAAQTDRIGFFVIDECHHISHSAKQRSVYRRLDSMIAKLGHPLVLGVTATADTETAANIQKMLNIDQVIIDKTIRSNLTLADNRNIADKLSYITRIVEKQEKTLIFVNSRKKAVELASQLRERLPELEQQVAFYHAGLNNEWRNRIEEWYRLGAVKVVVATSAFGEGVDFSDIRHVIKYHLAFNLTTFNQQCGRAGRDGEAAVIHLLFGQEDIKLNHLILQDTAPERSVIGNIYLLLKEEVKHQQQVRLTNREIAEQLRAKGRGFVHERSVGTALRILEELQLIWRETAGSRRAISLYPEPGHKRDLEQSATYYEGLLEKTEFSLFAHRIMNAGQDEILAWINRPLYPQDT